MKNCLFCTKCIVDPIPDLCVVSCKCEVPFLESTDHRVITTQLVYLSLEGDKSFFLLSRSDAIGVPTALRPPVVRCVNRKSTSKVTCVP